MNAEQLTLERSRIAIEVRQALRLAGYTYEQKVTEDAVYIEVNHIDAPGWHAYANVETSFDAQVEHRQNYLRIPHAVRGLNFKSGNHSKRGIVKMIERLNLIRDENIRINQSNADREKLIKELEDQRSRDLTGINLPDWVTVNIITSSTQKGLYSVSFDDGSPMESLTADQISRLALLLTDFNEERVTAMAATSS